MVMRASPSRRSSVPASIIPRQATARFSTEPYSRSKGEGTKPSARSSLSTRASMLRTRATLHSHHAHVGEQREGVGPGVGIGAVTQDALQRGHHQHLVVGVHRLWSRRARDPQQVE